MLKTTLAIAAMLLLIGCAHVPTAQECANLKNNPDTQNTPCVPNVCMGWENCTLLPVILAIP